jgi:hypothetical protein
LEEKIMLINGKEVDVRLHIISGPYAVLFVGDYPIFQIYKDGTARLIGSIPQDNPEGIQVNPIGQIRLT